MGDGKKGFFLFVLSKTDYSSMAFDLVVFIRENCVRSQTVSRRANCIRRSIKLTETKIFVSEFREACICWRKLLRRKNGEVSRTVVFIPLCF